MLNLIERKSAVPSSRLILAPRPSGPHAFRVGPALAGAEGFGLAFGAGDRIFGKDLPLGPSPPCDFIARRLQLESDAGFARIHVLAGIGVVVADFAHAVFVDEPASRSGESIEMFADLQFHSLRAALDRNFIDLSRFRIGKNGIRLGARAGQVAKIVTGDVQRRETHDRRLVPRIGGVEIARLLVERQRKSFSLDEHGLAVILKLRRAGLRPREWFLGLSARAGSTPR